MKISDIGKEMLTFQTALADKYGYKPLTSALSSECREKYTKTLPSYFQGCLSGKKTLIYSLDGTPIANGYERVVISDYGAFIEIAKDDIIRENIKVKAGQEYRYRDERYSKRVKYLWLTAKDTSDCKIYFQKKTVTYADYRPDFFYISPFECYIEGK